MQKPMRIAVVGATGRVGHHVADVLTERGHDVVPIARSLGVDVITREGLAEALAGADAIVDTATWPTPDEAEATRFFTTAARNLHDAGQAAGAGRLVVISIIGTDKFGGGYGKAKLAHEEATWLFVHAQDELWAKRRDVPWTPYNVSGSKAKVYYWSGPAK